MKWTEDKIKILESGINNKLTHKEIAIILGIDKNSVRLKAQRLNISSQYLERLKSLKETIYCQHCKKSFESLISDNRKFCSQSCSTIHNNSIRMNVRTNTEFNCKNCNRVTKLKKNSKGIFCESKCQQEYYYKEKIELWKEGKLLGFTGKTKALSSWLRRYMLEKYNNTCQKCGWNELHPVDKRALVEINHIDGNAENNNEENLEVICPNCHSMTPNFRARNKISSRNRK